MSAVSELVSLPSAERGYRDLASCYREAGMGEEAEAVEFLISEKFRADITGSDQGQHRDHTVVP